MLSFNRPTNENLSKTFADFIPQSPINNAPLPQNNKIKKDKFEKKYGMLYTAGSVATGAGILYALHRGGKLGNLTQYIKTHATRLKAKALEAVKNSPSLDFLQKIKLNVMVRTSNFLRKLQGLGNINPIKDIITDRGLIQLEEKFHIKGKTFFDKITNYFIGFGKKLAHSKYKKPEKDFMAFKNVLSKAIEEIEKMPTGSIGGKSPAELATRLRELSKLSKKELENIIVGFDFRFDEMMKVLQENSEKKFVNSLMSASGKTRSEKFFNKIKELGDFIPTREMQPYHDEIFKGLFGSKRLVSNSIIDLNKKLSTSLDNIFYNNSLQNEKLRKNYLNLQEIISNFINPKKNNFIRKDVREKLILELQDTIKNFQEIMPETTKAQRVQELLNLIQSDKRGAIEEAVSLCKILKDKNPALYQSLIKARNKFQKSFNNAIDFETDKSYRKMLDFSLHSLTTDLFTQAIGIGTIGYILANKKKSAKEKIPSILKEGLPVAGGLLVAFLCNLRQVASGPGSLFLAIVSGIALNRIGSVVSKKYLQTEQQNKQLVA